MRESVGSVSTPVRVAGGRRVPSAMPRLEDQVPIVMNMRWPGISLDQYEEVRRIVGWEREAPPGAIYHVCSHDGAALRITDVWENQESWDDFSMNRLTPCLQRLGLTGSPETVTTPAHAIFAPRYDLRLSSGLSFAAGN